MVTTVLSVISNSLLLFVFRHQKELHDNMQILYQILATRDLILSIGWSSWNTIWFSFKTFKRARFVVTLPESPFIRLPMQQCRTRGRATNGVMVIGCFYFSSPYPPFLQRCSCTTVICIRLLLITCHKEKNCRQSSSPLCLEEIKHR